MVSLFRNCIYQGKNLYRDKGLVFWSLLYPLIMAMFFYTSFNGIIDMKIEKIDVGISSNNKLSQMFQDIDMINLHEIEDESMEVKLESEEIKVYVDEYLNLVVNKSGIEQTIVKEIVDQIKQMEKMNLPMENFDFSVDYIEDKNQKAQVVTTIFYSLVAMVSTYGVTSGIETASLIQANLTNVGRRINIAPLKKKEFLFAGILVSLGINILSNILLLVFIKYGLKLDLFTEIKYTAIFIILGNLFGVALGIFIGVSNKQSTNTKTLIAIGFTLFLSFLCGMMSIDFKIMIEQKLPILGKINPIAIITNNLYRVNLLENTSGVVGGIIVLSLFSTVLILASYIFLRRKTYDSI